MTNKIEKVEDVVNLLSFLSGATGLSSRVQQECKEAERVLTGGIVKPVNIVLSSAPAPAPAPTPPVLISAGLLAKPWRHGVVNVPVNPGVHAMADVMNWLAASNVHGTITEIEHMERLVVNPKIYELLYRTKS